MRSAKKRVFSIERGNSEPEGNLPVVSDNSAQARHNEIMQALEAIRGGMTPQENAPQSEGASQQVV